MKYDYNPYNNSKFSQNRILFLNGSSIILISRFNWSTWKDEASIPIWSQILTWLPFGVVNNGSLQNHSNKCRRALKNINAYQLSTYRLDAKFEKIFVIIELSSLSLSSLLNPEYVELLLKMKNTSSACPIPKHKF